ncbi:hypothetical protein JKI95_09725 [Corynebacterium aquatimens]|uniref:S1 family peptidase n=1 Tax=Corynebacterium aquatimens TaxID=1190508 RepID=UPI00253FC2D4|nr:S1 family peptidase [Corynebacterium aquatimens]QYH19377.1 hypothetical protein JKI95_09725 [Corynebacterium aquatimens]
MRSRLAAVAVACATAITPCVIAIPASAAPAPALVAHQGGKVFISKDVTQAGSDCTIGYNDVAERKSYTAAHCGEPGDKVYLTNAAGQVYPTPAGTFYPSERHEGEEHSNDWGEIEWNANVSLGGNPYGGTYVGPQALAPGDKVCYHGFTTHGSRGVASCGTYVGRVGSSFSSIPRSLRTRVTPAARYTCPARAWWACSPA